MAYKTKLRNLLEGNFQKAAAMPTSIKQLRRVLVDGSKNLPAVPTNIEQLLRLVYETEFSAYIKTYVDPDVQADTLKVEGFSRGIDLISIAKELLQPEGWLEEVVVGESAPYVDYKVIMPLRERVALNENALEVVAISTVIYALVANAFYLK